MADYTRALKTLLDDEHALPAAISKAAIEGMEGCFHDYVTGRAGKKDLLGYILLVLENPGKVGEEAMAKASVAADQRKMIDSEMESLRSSMPNRIIRPIWEYRFNRALKRQKEMGTVALAVVKAAGAVQAAR